MPATRDSHLHRPPPGFIAPKAHVIRPEVRRHFLVRRSINGRFPTFPHDRPPGTGGFMTRRFAVGPVALALALPLTASAQAGAADLRAPTASIWTTART